MGGNGSRSGKKIGQGGEYVDASNSSVSATTAIGESLNQTGFISSLSKSESSAITSYTGSGYRVNDYLRGSVSTLKDKYKKTNTDLEKALAKSTLTKGVVTHRAASLEALFGAEGSSIGYIKRHPESLQELKGAVIKDRGFMSTSLNKGTVEGMEGSNVMFNIKAPKGTHAAYVESLSIYKEESELLFQKGSSMKVDSISWDKKSNSVIVNASIIK